MSLEFRPLTINDKKFFDEYYKKDPQISGYTSFVTLFTWRNHMSLEWNVCDGEPILRIPLKGGRYGFFAPQNKKEAFKKLVEILNKEPYQYVLLGISGEQKSFAEELFPGKFNIKRTRNSDNYIYLRESLATLSGKKLHSKKNHLNKFRKTYQYEYRTIDDSMIEACMEVSRKWCERKCTDDDLDVSSCEEALKNMKELNIKGGALIHNEKIIAFSLGEKINDEMAIIHFEKADISYDGAFAAINNEFIVHEWTDVKYINREEDLGSEGLRKSKMSYHPCMMFETYDAGSNA